MLYDVVPHGVCGEFLRVLDDHVRQFLLAVDVHLAVAETQHHGPVAVLRHLVAFLEEDRVDGRPERAAA